LNFAMTEERIAGKRASREGKEKFPPPGFFKADFARLPEKRILCPYMGGRGAAGGVFG